ncbi:MAG: YiiX/YebB-like N1pC/P60 family cysteine hydrolase [Pseudomonadota bacterium]
MNSIFSGIYNGLVNWLSHQSDDPDMPLSDFERLSYEIRPCDVLLIEGRSRVGEVIKAVTQSPWIHAALYIGRLHDIDSPEVRERLLEYYDAQPEDQLVIEAELGKGVIISPLKRYVGDHMRICRPKDIARQDAQDVVAFTISCLGLNYNVRQILDLARFFFPYAFLPRRWRSSLFNYHPGTAAKTVCSTLLAEAFMSVKYPILPVIRESENGELHSYQRNPQLYTPKDFDYSPYFEIIKYPFYGTDAMNYKQLPWNPSGLLYEKGTGFYLPKLADDQPAQITHQPDENTEQARES